MSHPKYNFLVTALQGLRGGTFLECGAFDGETASNTLPLEYEYGWSGYLIEPNPYYYTQIVGKNRNVTSLNACISVETKDTLLNLPVKCPDNKGGGCVQRSSMTSETNENTIRVPCFTFTSIMNAYNIQSIDYFSLDVEGAELAVLKTIPFDKIDIKSLSVEYVHTPGGEESITDFLKSKNYVLLEHIHFSDKVRKLFVDDLIFIKDDLVVD